MKQTHSGVTTVILGDGPSLNAEDVSLAACAPDTRLLAINYSIGTTRHRPLTFYYYHHDKLDQMVNVSRVLEEHAAGLVDVYTADPAAEGRVPWPVIPFSGKFGFEARPEAGLRSGAASGYAAINLAYHLGARDILLLGYDCCDAPNGEFSWAKDSDDSSKPKYDYETWKRNFNDLAKVLPAYGVRVRNASRHTALEAFPLVKLEDALEGAAERPATSLEN